MAEPSGRRHRLVLAELSDAYREGRFEPGTLVRAPGSSQWLPPYDLAELEGVRPPPAEPSSPLIERPAQLTFSDETVSLGVAESAALSRQVFEAQREREASSPHHAAPLPPDDSGFDDEEVATVVRSLDQLNHLRELAQAPSKQPTLKPPPGSLPAAALPSRPSYVPAEPPAEPAPEPPLPRAVVKRHKPTLLGVPAPAVPGAPAPLAERSPLAEQPVTSGLTDASPPPSPASPQELTSEPPERRALPERRAQDVTTAPPPPSTDLAQRETEAAPVPPSFTAEWVNSSRMPALSSPSVPRDVTGFEAAPSAGGAAPAASPGPAPLLGRGAPLGEPSSPDASSASAPPGLSPARSDEFLSELPPRGSSLGWMVTLVFLLVVGAGLGVLYWKKPRLFSAGRERVEEFAQRVTRALGVSSPPTHVEGPPFDTASAGAVLERAAQQAPSCAEPGGPTGRGRVKVLFQQDGHALNAVVSPPFHETQVGRCLVGLFRATQVPAFGGEPVIVSKTFTVR